MKIKYYILAGVLCATLHSCIAPKKYNKALSERDSLSVRTTSLEAQVSSLETDTMHLHHQIADLQKTYNTLNDNNNKLNDNYSKSSSLVSQLSGDRQKREERL